MESGVQSGERKNEGAGAAAAKTITDAHHGFFQDLNTIHTGLMERLNEAHQKHARPIAEAQSPPNIQSMHEEYSKAIQAAYTSGEMSMQVIAAFEKYKEAAIRVLRATTDPVGLALLSQSMYLVAMYAAQIQIPKVTP
jgi:hypothetical protein